jgi:hypothetical protein
MFDINSKTFNNFNSRSRDYKILTYQAYPSSHKVPGSFDLAFDLSAA